jgi:hypothetical protein
MLFKDTGFEDAFPGMTLLEVLSGNSGGLVALGRATVGALLNAAAISGYPGVPEDVIASFNAVFDGDKEQYNALKDEYEALQDPCPLD